MPWWGTVGFYVGFPLRFRVYLKGSWDVSEVTSALIGARRIRGNCQYGYLIYKPL